ncbi:hypothetical protein [Pseudoalteromonas xiamenensis]|uniref:Outer membrane protein beta-barrel domain-containing protein n=1 Tax=Pseudoalteromonas xiamenensis TaxID=882626 RepID=A0A975DKF6_9GAMM|nr:hypothetical protein [Pseudoalteromonas xiamenensis]QTH73380.1 hypothetical protein J5O05_17880 [Pseudoalteromonas xiamenensis]
MKRVTAFVSVWLCVALSPIFAWADGMVVDKVYHPYVLPNEKAAEWRLHSRQTDTKNYLAQRFGLGFAVAEGLAIEGFAIGERNPNDRDNYDLAAFEGEVRWQIVEQGKYWADWGLLFELEKRTKESAYEATTGLIFEKEIGRTSLTMNAFLIREWGKDIEDEWESEFRAQYRYRLVPAFQPAIEIYAGQDFFGIGPGFIGLYRFEGQRQLKWEAGFISEIGHNGKDHSFRLALEYEY